MVERINRVKNIIIDHSKKNFLTTDDNMYIYPDSAFEEKRLADLKKKFPDGLNVDFFKNYLL